MQHPGVVRIIRQPGRRHSYVDLRSKSEAERFDYKRKVCFALTVMQNQIRVSYHGASRILIDDHGWVKNQRGELSKRYDNPEGRRKVITFEKSQKATK